MPSTPVCLVVLPHACRPAAPRRRAQRGRQRAVPSDSEESTHERFGDSGTSCALSCSGACPQVALPWLVPQHTTHLLAVSAVLQSPRPTSQTAAAAAVAGRRTGTEPMPRTSARSSPASSAAPRAAAVVGGSALVRGRLRRGQHGRWPLPLEAMRHPRRLTGAHVLGHAKTARAEVEHGARLPASPVRVAKVVWLRLHPCLRPVPPCAFAVQERVHPGTALGRPAHGQHHLCCSDALDASRGATQEAPPGEGRRAGRFSWSGRGWQRRCRSGGPAVQPEPSRRCTLRC